MQILDALPIGSTYEKAVSPVMNDLLFLTQLGVRSIGISAVSSNLNAGDIGSPIDPLVQDALKIAGQYGQEPFSFYYPAEGQYMLAFRNVPPPELTLTCAVIPEIYGFGTPVNFQFTASGGVTPYVWSVTTGTLPAGWSLSSSGALTGAAIEIETYEFVVSCTDGQGTRVECLKIDGSGYTVEIKDPPTITGDAPAGAINIAYSYSYTIAGGVGSLTTAIVSGALPDGVSLSSGGVLSGTPTEAGSFSWTVRVTDSEGVFSDLPDGSAIAADGPWFIGPVAQNGALGGSNLFYKRSFDPSDWSSAPIAGPSGFSAITRISTANRAVFRQGNIGEMAVSFNGGGSWTACTGFVVNTDRDVYWNGNFYYHNTKRSADGITWTDIPNLPASSTVRLARQSDGAIVTFTNSFAYHISTDDGATWTTRGGYGNTALQLATDGERIVFTVSDLSGRYTDDLFATSAAPTGSLIQYSAFHGGGGFLAKTFPRGIIDLSDGSAQSGPVLDVSLCGGDASPSICGAGGVWLALEFRASGAPDTCAVRISTDGGTTWGEAALVYGPVQNIACMSDRP